MTNETKVNSICYDISCGYAYGISEVCAKNLDTVISFKQKFNGYMLIGAFTFDIVDGICHPDLRRLNDGEHNVCVHTEDEIIPADKIKKSGRIISLVPLGNSEQLALRAELLELKNQIRDLKLTLSDIQAKIDGVSIL